MEVSAHKPHKPEWGSLDILEACGASDLGSNPSSGACAFSRSGYMPISACLLSTTCYEEGSAVLSVQFLLERYLNDSSILLDSSLDIIGALVSFRMR